MPTTEFQRARAPEQIEQRRAALLQAATDLIAQGGLEAVSLTAIARGAGLAKSNVYRYFESREHILLELLLRDELHWVGNLERALVPLAGRGTPETVADVLGQSLLQHPTACLLISVVANVLEHNVSIESVRSFKTRVLEISIRAGNALHVALPDLPHEATPALLRMIHATIAGLWPMAHPAPRACAAIEDPMFEPLRSDWEADLRFGLQTLLAGATPARP